MIVDHSKAQSELYHTRVYHFLRKPHIGLTLRNIDEEEDGKQCSSHIPRFIPKTPRGYRPHKAQKYN